MPSLSLTESLEYSMKNRLLLFHTLEIFNGYSGLSAFQTPQFDIYHVAKSFKHVFSKGWTGTNAFKRPQLDVSQVPVFMKDAMRNLSNNYYVLDGRRTRLLPCVVNICNTELCKSFIYGRNDYPWIIFEPNENDENVDIIAYSDGDMGSKLVMEYPSHYNDFKLLYTDINHLRRRKLHDMMDFEDFEHMNPKPSMNERVGMIRDRWLKRKDRDDNAEAIARTHFKHAKAVGISGEEEVHVNFACFVLGCMHVIGGTHISLVRYHKGGTFTVIEMTPAQRNVYEVSMNLMASEL